MRYFIEFSYNGSTFLAIKFSQMRFLCAKELEKHFLRFYELKLKLQEQEEQILEFTPRKMFAHFDFDGEISEN